MTVVLHWQEGSSDAKKQVLKQSKKSARMKPPQHEITPGRGNKEGGNLNVLRQLKLSKMKIKDQEDKDKSTFYGYILFIKRHKLQLTLPV